MKVDIYSSAYTLRFPTRPNAAVFDSTIEGCLLKLVDEKNKKGYASFQTWEKLGDEPASSQWQKFKKGEKPKQLTRSFLMAMCDLCGKEKLDTNLQLYSPESKIKIGPELDWIERLYQCSAEKIILDANNSYQLDELLRALDQLDSSWRSRISYIEDPFAYDLQEWGKLQARGYPLAWDFQDQLLSESDLTPVDYIIVKPARDDWKRLLSYKKPLIFTHYMDHPVGVNSAFYQAQRYQEYTGRVEQHGLAPHAGIVIEQENLWQNPQTISESGWGFGESLEKLNWKLEIQGFTLGN